MKQKRNIKINLLLVLLIMLALSATSTLGFCEFFQSSKVTSSSSQTIDQARNQAYGTKPTIAVMKFDDKSGSQANYGGAPIGSGMKEQLVTALTQTNAFIVVERDSMKDIIGEQDFGASGRVKGNTAAAIGEIEGADFLIYGAVTEYEGKQAEAKGGFGGWTGTVLNTVKGAISQDHVAIDIRIVDSKSGRILTATSVEGKSRDLKAGFGGMFGNTLGGLSGSYKNPLQKAVRSCMIKSVNWIAENLMGNSAQSPSVQQNYQQQNTEPNRERTSSNKQYATQHSKSITQPSGQNQASKTQSNEPDYAKKLATLKKLKDNGLITEEEYNESRKEILKELVK